MTALPDGWTTRRPTLDDVPAILREIAAAGMERWVLESAVA